MSSSANFHDDSDSDFDNEVDEWLERRVLENRQIDSMIDEVAFRIPTLSLQPTHSHSRRFIERQREKGHEGVFEQYFSDDPIYPPDVFRTRFRMQKSLFERIMTKLVATDPFFQQKRDAAGRLGMSSIQKCTAALRVLAYGTGADLHDEYLRMSAQTIRKSVEKFVEGVISNFGDEYLRRPNERDIAYLLQIGEQRGFPGMLGSIDCMHWEWKNCPSGWAGQFTGRNGKATIILERLLNKFMVAVNRYKRLNTNVTRWVAVYKEAYNQKSSGMSDADVEKIAQQIYGCGKSTKFTHHEVFEKIMRHIPKWQLKLGGELHRSRTDRVLEGDTDADGDCGSSKKSRTTEGEENQSSSHDEVHASGTSTIRRPIGRDKAKGKRKQKVTSSQSIVSDEYTDVLNAMRVTREKEVEALNRLGDIKLEASKDKVQTNIMVSKMNMLNTLLGKDSLSAHEESIKIRLMQELFPC